MDTNLRQHVQICKDITFILLIFIYLFTFWPHCMACGFSFPGQGSNLGPSAVKTQSLNHWTAREIPTFFFFPCMISLIIVLVSLCSTWSGGNLILVKLCGPCYPFLLKFSSKFLPSGEFGRIPNLLHHLGIWYLAYQTWAVHCWVVLHAYPQDTSIAHCSFCSSHATLEHVDWRVWEVGSLGSAQGWARCKVSFLLVYFLAASHGMWDLSFQIRDWTRTLCIGSAKS